MYRSLLWSSLAFGLVGPLRPSCGVNELWFFLAGSILRESELRDADPTLLRPWWWLFDVRSRDPLEDDDVGAHEHEVRVNPARLLHHLVHAPQRLRREAREAGDKHLPETGTSTGQRPSRRAFDVARARR